jgi:hypothetical protein
MTLLAMRRQCWLVSILFLAACTSFDYTTPPPTPQTIAVTYSPYLSWMVESLHTCSNNIQQIALVIEESASHAEPEAGEVILWLGTPPQGYSAFASQLGWEELTIITHPNNESTQLDVSSIVKSYTSLEPPYQAWTYPQSSQPRQVFDAIMLENKVTSPHVLLAPDPEAMLQAISGDPNAIGYLPHHWLDERVTPIPLETDLQQPILALTQEESQGLTRQLLACLQNVLP